MDGNLASRKLSEVKKLVNWMKAFNGGRSVNSHPHGLLYKNCHILRALKFFFPSPEITQRVSRHVNCCIIAYMKEEDGVIRSLSYASSSNGRPNPASGGLKTFSTGKTPMMLCPLTPNALKRGFSSSHPSTTFTHFLQVGQKMMDQNG